MRHLPPNRGGAHRCADNWADKTATDARRADCGDRCVSNLPPLTVRRARSISTAELRPMRPRLDGRQLKCVNNVAWRLLRPLFAGLGRGSVNAAPPDLKAQTVFYVGQPSGQIMFRMPTEGAVKLRYLYAVVWVHRPTSVLECDPGLFGIAAR